MTGGQWGGAEGGAEVEKPGAEEGVEAKAGWGRGRRRT